MPGSHTMSKAALEALYGSVTKWEEILAGTRENRGSEDCPLCLLFYRNYCEGCPVMARTGKTHCTGTPFVPYANYISAVEAGFREAKESERQLLAKRELDFLKSLLPTDAIPDETQTPSENNT